MKKVIPIFILICSQSSCRQEIVLVPESPLITFELRILKSRQWKTAYTSITSMNFAELTDDHNGVGSGTVQNWKSTILRYDLEQDQTQNILVKPYWKSTLLGVDPNFIGSTFVTAENIFIENLEYEYLDYIPFRNQIEVNDEEKYLVCLIINPDQVLVKEGDRYHFFTSKVSAQMSEL